MGLFTVPEIAPGALLTPRIFNGIIGSNGFRAFNQLGEENFDDSTNVPVRALVTPYANFTWNGVNHGRVSAAAGASVQMNTVVPVLEWSQLASWAISPRLPTAAAASRVRIYHSCAHTGTNVLLSSLQCLAPVAVYSATLGTARQLHAGDVLYFTIAGLGGSAARVTDLSIGLRFKRNPIP